MKKATKSKSKIVKVGVGEIRESLKSVLGSAAVGYCTSFKTQFSLAETVGSHLDIDGWEWECCEDFYSEVIRLIVCEFFPSAYYRNITVDLLDDEGTDWLIFVEIKQ